MLGDSSIHSCEPTLAQPEHGAMYQTARFTEPNGFTGGIEGPACDRHGNLYAVNYEKHGTVGKITPEGVGSIFVELPDGSVGNGIRFGPDGYMYIADYTKHNILRVDMNSKLIGVHAHEPAMHQPNDIAVMRYGTLFASDPDWATSTGQIWQIDLNGVVRLLESGMGTANGIEVGPDEDRLYVNESVQRRVWVYDLPRGGVPCNKRLLIEFPDFGLDGMRCDVQGNLYVTRHGKGSVIKLSPQGDVLKEVQLAGKDPTNVTFGGPDGRTCYVTVADKGNVEHFRVDEPGRCWSLLHPSKPKQL